MWKLLWTYSMLFRRIRKIAKSDCYLRHVRLSASNNSAPTERIFMKFDTWVILENLSWKFKFLLKPDKNNECFA